MTKDERRRTESIGHWSSVIGQSFVLRPSALVVATLFVAFFLRAYRLADQNVWWDEGWSIWLSQKDLMWIAWRTAMDEHPPLHYWMLHFSNFIAGTSAFAGRFLSLAFGVLTVALVYRIGKRVGASITAPVIASEAKQSPTRLLEIASSKNRSRNDNGAWIGILAALFLATARFHIWWSQDIKNYTPSIFFAFAAVWFALEVLGYRLQVSDSAVGGQRSAISHQRSAVSRQPSAVSLSSFVLRPSSSVLRPVLAYALCAALALWTHYLAALVIIALNIYVVLIALYESRFSFQFLVFSSQFSGFSFQRSAGSGQPSVFRPSSFGLRLSSFVLWLIGSLAHWLIANALAAALFAPWLFVYLRNAAEWTAAPTFDFVLFLKLVATVLPLGITTNIDDYAWLTIVFTALAALPVFSVLYSVFSKKLNTEHLHTEHSNTEHSPLPPASCLLPTLIVAFPPLLVYALSLTPVAFFAPKIQARYLLILLPAYVMLLALGIQFLARLSRSFAIFALAFVLLANAFVLNDYYAARRLRDEYTTLANVINAFARQNDLVFLDTDQEWPTFLYHLRAPLDWLGVPNGKAMTEAEADALARRALARHDAVWLVVIPDALATDPQKFLEARLARELPKRFEQTFDDKRLVLYARDERDLVQVARENFAPQVVRAQRVNDDLTLLGYDLPVREARGGDTVRVVTYWNARVAQPTLAVPIPAGERVRVQTGFFVPPDARELVINVNSIELARLRVEPRAARAGVGEIAHRVDYRLGDAIHFIGYDLPTLNLKPNETLNVKLYWRAERPIEKSYTVFVQLVGAFNPRKNNPLWGQVDRAPSPPTNAWLPGEIIADAYRIVVDADAPPGTYTLIVGMYDAATGARLVVEGGGDNIAIGEIQVR